MGFDWLFFTEVSLAGLGSGALRTAAPAGIVLGLAVPCVSRPPAASCSPPSRWSP